MWTDAFISKPVSNAIKTAGKVVKKVMGGNALENSEPEYELTPKLKAKLSKEAPETLSEPNSHAFIDKSHYETAKAKFKKHGHWATPAPEEVKNFMSTQDQGYGKG